MSGRLSLCKKTDLGTIFQSVIFLGKRKCFNPQCQRLHPPGKLLRDGPPALRAAHPHQHCNLQVRVVTTSVTSTSTILMRLSSCPNHLLQDFASPGLGPRTLGRQGQEGQETGRHPHQYRLHLWLL